MRATILFAAATLWVIGVLTVGAGASPNNIDCDTTDGTVLVADPWTDNTAADFNWAAEYAALCAQANYDATSTSTTTTRPRPEPPYMGLFPKLNV